MANFKYFYFFF